MFCDRVVTESLGKLQRNEMTRNVAEAAYNEDWWRVRLLVEEGENVNDVTGRRFFTALHFAALRGKADICSFLLSRGANVTMADINGDTPLHIAADLHRADVCQLLVDYKADVTFVNRKGETPLLKALCRMYYRLYDFPTCTVCRPLITNESVNVANLHDNCAVHIAGRKGFVQLVQLLVDCGADVNALNEYGQTPLHTAAGGEKDCPELCSILLKHDAKIDAVDKDGNQPLHLACKRRHTSTSRFLLSHGAVVNASNEYGQTPLHTAAGGEKDCPELCSILLKHDAKIDAVDKDGNRPLHLACKRRHTSTSRFLLSRGAVVNALNEYGQTPLHTAADGERDSPELCYMLLKHNAKIDAVDKDGNQPLRLAWKQWHAATVRLLLSHGADVTVLNKQQRKPLHLANESVLKSYDSFGANANARTKDGETLLHTAAGGENDCPELCSMLLKHNAKIDAVDRDGNQPLHLACKRGHTRKSLFLLSCGADGSALNEYGQTPLHTAAGGKKDSPELCSILLEYNAINAVDKDGNRSLHLACKRRHTSTSRFLLSHGAVVNALNEYGQTPLHTAAGGEKDCPELCSILLKHDAKIDAVDKDGNQALHLACEAGLISTVQYLLDCNADVFSKNNFHQTVLHKAVCSKRDCFEVCEMLIAKGSPVNVTDSNGHTSLQLACQKGHMTTADVLVKSDADCNVLNVFGETLLHLACKSRVECVELCDKLISHGVNPHVADREGNLPLHVALKSRLSKTFCYLFQKCMLL